MTIQDWLETFVQAWTNHDTDTVISLFTKDVEYWETPYIRLESYARLADEWQGIREQIDIKVDTDVIGSYDNAHCVKWELQYKDRQGNQQSWAGLYLIQLNDGGQCAYFYQVGEKP